MTEPEIDEAAAVAWLEVQTQSGWPNRENAARAALAWKSRRDELEALIRPESILPLQAARDWRESAEHWRARAEELERAIVHDDAVAEAFIAAIRGKEVSDFMASFGAVREAMDLRARAEAAEAERDDLRATHERDMCADGHARIRYTPDEDFGPCPLCSLKRQLAQSGKAR